MDKSENNSVSYTRRVNNTYLLVPDQIKKRLNSSIFKDLRRFNYSNLIELFIRYFTRS